MPRMNGRNSHELPALPHLFALCVSLPLLLPIPGLEAVPPFAMGAALLSILLLMGQFLLDLVGRREGGTIRLIVLLFVGAAVASWLAGVLSFGFDAGAALSFVNWIALVGLVIAGQVMLASPRRIGWMLNTWVISLSLVALLVVVYLTLSFGPQLFTTTDRAPFQVALRGFIPSWPNYFGVALSTAVCVGYGRLAAGARPPFLRTQLAVLMVGLIVTFSRGSYVACIAGVGAITLVTGSRSRTALYFMVGGTLMVLIGIFVPAVNYQFLATFESDTSQSLGVLERFAFAREALRVWLERPAFGIGFSRFADFVDPALVYSANEQQSDLGSVHNEYVTTLLKGGWVVALALVLFLFAAFRLLRRVSRHPDLQIRQWGVAGIGVMANLCVAGLVLESLRTISVSAIFWVLVGALDGLMRKHRAAIAEPAPLEPQKDSQRAPAVPPIQGMSPGTCQ